MPGTAQRTSIIHVPSTNAKIPGTAGGTGNSGGGPVDAFCETCVSARMISLYVLSVGPISASTTMSTASSACCSAMYKARLAASQVFICLPVMDFGGVTGPQISCTSEFQIPTSPYSTRPSCTMSSKLVNSDRAFRTPPYMPQPGGRCERRAPQVR